MPAMRGNRRVHGIDAPSNEALSMQSANYTSPNIARALGLGGFENDAVLASAEKALRLLLLPSFHPELCLSFVTRLNERMLHVVTADEQVWRQACPSPQPTGTSEATAAIASSEFDRLTASLRDAVSVQSARVVVLDGMRAHTILRVDQQRDVDLSENVGRRGEYAAFVATAIQLAWGVVEHPVVRNALRDAGSYVGLTLPEQPVPAPKPRVRTVVLGPEDVAAQLLGSLKRTHGGP